MARTGLVPDLVLCSSAHRARETWELASEQIDQTVEAVIRDDLYHASPGSLIGLIRDLPQSVDSVLLVGHNPTFEDLALTLSGKGDQDGLREMAFKYPTGALAVIDFPIIDWEELGAGAGSLRSFVKPRSL